VGYVDAGPLEHACYLDGVERATNPLPEGVPVVGDKGGWYDLTTWAVLASTSCS